MELCASLYEGGTTPSFGVIKCCREVLRHTRLNVMIRPRGGDFLCSEHDLKCMAYEIEAARDLGADGLVFGCLTADGDIDLKALDFLMERAGATEVTFHRAFDLVRDPKTALEQLIEHGVCRLLTSGLRPKAVQGMEMIAALNAQSAGRIKIMAGSGVSPDNIMELAVKTGIREFHFSAKVPRPSDMSYRPEEDIMSGNYYIDEYDREVSSFRKIKAALEVIKGLAGRTHRQAEGKTMLTLN